MTQDRISVSRRISAPAEKLYLIVSTPAGHAQIDGSGMLVGPVDDRRLTTVGDTFDMDMDREPLGDIPGMGKYKVRNTVTQIIPNRLFEWTVGAVDQPPVGHVYGWALDPVTDAETDVTNYCDWSAISDNARSGREWPIVPLHMLERSVENLERVATDA